MKRIVTQIVLMSMASTLAFASLESGGNSSGGGDPEKLWEMQKKKAAEAKVRAEQAKKKAQEEEEAKGRAWYQRQLKHAQNIVLGGEMKARVLSVVRYLDPNDIDDPIARAAFISLKAQGLEQDVIASPYVAREKCLDEKGREKQLSTVQAKPGQKLIGSEICVDFASKQGGEINLMLRREYSNLVGLFIHDHARHFGYDDEDHRLAYAIAKAYDSFDTVIARLRSGVFYGENDLKKWEAEDVVLELNEYLSGNLDFSVAEDLKSCQQDISSALIINPTTNDAVDYIRPLNHPGRTRRSVRVPDSMEAYRSHHIVNTRIVTFFMERGHLGLFQDSHDGTIFMKCKKQKTATLSISDMYGVKVWEKKIKEGEKLPRIIVVPTGYLTREVGPDGKEDIVR